jgi:hypothetical protein
VVRRNGFAGTASEKLSKQIAFGLYRHATGTSGQLQRRGPAFRFHSITIISIATVVLWRPSSACIRRVCLVFVALRFCRRRRPTAHLLTKFGCSGRKQICT